MKILLVNEASGVHRNLRMGLEELGHEVTHIASGGTAYQGRKQDRLFGFREGPGLYGRLVRNFVTPHTIPRFYKYDIAHFILGMSLLTGKLVRYQDLPRLKNHGVKLGYYTVGCDEAGLPRVREDVKKLYPFCDRCMVGDVLGKSCAKEILGWRGKAGQYADLFDYCGLSAPSYDHAAAFFSNAKSQKIPFPLYIDPIAFNPARKRDKVRIIHAPTRRAVKGTDYILNAFEALKTRTKIPFEIDLIEGVSFDEYIRRIGEADILVDQLDVPLPGMAALEAMASGKIVVSGNMPGVADRFHPFMKDAPIWHGSSKGDDLVTTLASLLEQQDTFESIGHRARKFVETHHDHRKVTGAFLNLWSL